jgi:hypothetical protein
MRTEMLAAARGWLAENGYKVTWETEHAVIGDLALKEPTRYHGSAVAVLLVANEPVHVAQGRLNELREWKGRQEGRWICVIHPRDYPQETLVHLGRFDQAVVWPRANYYPGQALAPIP